MKYLAVQKKTVNYILTHVCSCVAVYIIQSRSPEISLSLIKCLSFYVLCNAVLVT